MNHQFLVMWCNEGLEFVVDVTADQQRRMWTRLKEGAACESSVPNINHLKLRARYNPQRHYEIYMIEAEPDVDENAIRTWFKTTPQDAVDAIRERGHCLHSDRAEEENVVIR